MNRPAHLLLACLLAVAAFNPAGPCSVFPPAAPHSRIYLYAHANPINGWDPSGRNLSSFMASSFIKLNFAATSAATTLAASESAQLAFFIAVVSYYHGYQTAGVGGVIAEAAVNAIPFGPIARHFPRFLSPRIIREHTETLLAETRRSVPMASRNAAASGLRFSDEVTDIVVRGQNVPGADIVATVVRNGASKRLGRDLMAFQGDLSLHNGKGLYDALVEKAGNQFKDVDIGQIQVEMTENAMNSVSNWKDIVAEKIKNFRILYPELEVLVVTPDGSDVVF